MKTSRIVPYKKTAGEQLHYNLVHNAQRQAFNNNMALVGKNNSKHQGSKPLSKLKNF